MSRPCSTPKSPSSFATTSATWRRTVPSYEGKALIGIVEKITRTRNAYWAPSAALRPSVRLIFQARHHEPCCHGTEDGVAWILTGMKRAGRIRDEHLDISGFGVFLRQRDLLMAGRLADKPAHQRLAFIGEGRSFSSTVVPGRATSVPTFSARHKPARAVVRSVRATSFSAFSMALKGSMAPSIFSSASGTPSSGRASARAAWRCCRSWRQVVNALRVRFFETPDGYLCGIPALLGCR